MRLGVPDPGGCQKGASGSPLKAEGKMLAGGLPVGGRAFVCMIEAVPDPHPCDRLIPDTAPPSSDRPFTPKSRTAVRFRRHDEETPRGRASAATSSRNARRRSPASAGRSGASSSNAKHPPVISRGAATRPPSNPTFSRQPTPLARRYRTARRHPSGRRGRGLGPPRRGCRALRARYDQS